ncbi:MAG: response regulator transcription factor [Spirochaetia bacterium]
MQDHLYSEILRFLESVGRKCGTCRMCEAILKDLKHLIPYDMGYLPLFDRHGRIISGITENVSELSKRQYFTYYMKINPCRDTPVHTRSMYTEWKEFTDTEFYTDYGRREHIDFSAGLQFHYPKGRLMGILFITRSGSRGFVQLDIEVLNLIQPHLENLLRLSRKCDIECSYDPSAERPSENLLSKFTIRERQIIILICRGIHTKEIGSYLLITPGTVYRHVSNIFEKAGVSSRGELTALITGLKENVT